MKTPEYTVHCTKKKRIARDVYELAFSKPERFTFKPGQFVLLNIPLVEHPTDIQTRALSIASTPAESELLFAVKLVAGGRISRWIVEVLKEGTDVNMKGPFGFFVLKEDNPKDLLFICTSTGIGPFRSQIKAALEAGDTHRMDLVYGVRSEEDLFWADEFETLTKTYDNFSLHLALSNPTDGWKGHRGRVQTLVPQIMGLQEHSQNNSSERAGLAGPASEDTLKGKRAHERKPSRFPFVQVYVCGSPDMTKELKQLCMEQWQLDKKDVHIEGYI